MERLCAPAQNLSHELFSHLLRWIKGGVPLTAQPQKKAVAELIPIRNRNETPDSEISSPERNFFGASELFSTEQKRSSCSLRGKTSANGIEAARHASKERLLVA